MKSHRRTAATLAAMAFVQIATPAAAADRFWTCTTNNFTNGNCWSTPGTVVSADNLLLRSNGATAVVANFPGAAGASTSLLIQSLTLDGSAIDRSPTLNVTNGSLETSAALKIGIDFAARVGQTGGSVRSYSMDMNRLSSYSLSGGSNFTYFFNNFGSMLVNGTGQLSSGTMVNEGTVIINGGGASATTFYSTNNGVISLTGSTYTASRATNESGARLIGANSTMSNLIQNRGLIQATGGTLALPTSGGRLVSSGELRIEKISTVSLPSGVVNDSAGVINLKGVDTGSGPQATLGNGDGAGTRAGTLINFGKLQGAGVVAMPVDHRGGGSVSVGAGSMLTFNQSFTSAAGSAMASDGDLYFAGPASFHNGAVIEGTGIVRFGSTVNIGGAGAAGRMTVFGSAFLGGSYNADILGNGAGLAHDLFEVYGKLGFGEASVLKLNSGSFVAQAGQSFKLFDWSVLSGQFGAVDASALLLADGAKLDMSRLYVDGTLAVVAVPELATWAMTIAGIFGLLARRRLGRAGERRV